MIQIALRFDDPSALSDHALEEGILRVLEQAGVPATFAVVPFAPGPEGPVPVSAENVPHLAAAQAERRIEVAQHGHSHEPIASTPEGVRSEFHGVPREEQRRRLDAGRRVLQAAFPGPIRGFVPPWNTYDAATVALLEERDYGYVSAGMDYPRGLRPALRVLPHTCDIHHLATAVRNAERHIPRWKTIISIQHHYDFQEARDHPGPLSLAAYLDRLKRLADRPDVHFTTLADLAKQFPVAATWAAQGRNRFKSRLHWRLQRHIADYMLYTRPLWAYLR
jgi:peptidoglycan/xylan/chitin deacetylase (PgdA/CDA1 family)